MKIPFQKIKEIKDIEQTIIGYIDTDTVKKITFSYKDKSISTMNLYLLQDENLIEQLSDEDEKKILMDIRDKLTYLINSDRPTLSEKIQIIFKKIVLVLKNI